MGGLRGAGHTSRRVAPEKAATQEDVRRAFEELTDKEFLHLSIFADFKAPDLPNLRRRRPFESGFLRCSIRQQAMEQRESRVQALPLWCSPKHHPQCDKERPRSLQCCPSRSDGLSSVHESRGPAYSDRTRGKSSENIGSDRAVVCRRYRSGSGYLVFEAGDERPGDSIGPGHFQNGVRDHCQENEKKARENERTGSCIT